MTEKKKIWMESPPGREKGVEGSEQEILGPQKGKRQFIPCFVILQSNFLSWEQNFPLYSFLQSGFSAVIAI